MLTEFDFLTVDYAHNADGNTHLSAPSAVTLFPYYEMERHETGEQKAEQLVRSGFKQLHWTEADPETRPKGHKRKVK